MKEFAVGAWLGIIAGLGLALFMFHGSPVEQRSELSKKLTEECQKELKRTENCVIVAVPENKGE
jgi:hypothetical protein